MSTNPCSDVQERMLKPDVATTAIESIGKAFIPIGPGSTMTFTPITPAPTDPDFVKEPSPQTGRLLYTIIDSIGRPAADPDGQVVLKTLNTLYYTNPIEEVFIFRNVPGEMKIDSAPMSLKMRDDRMIKCIDLLIDAHEELLALPKGVTIPTGVCRAAAQFSSDLSTEVRHPHVTAIHTALIELLTTNNPAAFPEVTPDP